MPAPPWTYRNGSSACLVAVAACFGGGQAKAGDGAETVTLGYVAPEGCPTEADFVRSVNAKTHRFRLGSIEQPHRVFTVIVEGVEPSRGVLVISGGSVSDARRTVDGANCLEVVAALALATALAVDPPSAVPELSEAAPPPAPPVPTPRATVSAPETRTLQERANEPRGSSSGLGFGLGAYATGISGVAPKPLWGGGLGLEAVDAPRHPRLRLRLNLELTSAKDADVGEASISFSLGIVRLAVCPHALSVGSVHAAVCGQLASGAIFASSKGVPDSRTDAGFWSSAGAGLLLGVDLGGGLSLSIEGGVDAPFRRDRFVLRPDGEFHHVSPAAGRAGIGIFRILR